MMINNWIVLKFDNFKLENTIVGTKLDVSQVLDNRYVDYRVSSESLKRLASLLVLSKHDFCSPNNLKQVWRSDVIEKYQCYYLMNECCVGVIIFFSETDDFNMLFECSNKLEYIISKTKSKYEKNNVKTKVVVNLTALGLNTDEISTLLNLTSRGVDYHLDKAKRYLGASNKANLVFKASQCGWI